MKKFLTYSAVAIVALAFVTPALGATIILPSAPVPPSPGLTMSGIVESITTFINYLIVIATIVSVAFFIWGGVKFAMNKPDEGKLILRNAAIGLLAILGVGLVVNTISAFIGRGGNVG